MSPLASAITRYAVAVSATAIALALRAAMVPLWGLTLPFIFFYPAIMLSAWFGGLGPGIFTTLLCAAAAISPSLSPSPSLRVDNLAGATGLLVFVGIGILISCLTEALRRTRARLAAQVRRLEADTEALRHGEEARARLAAIVQSSDDAIVSKTLDGTITSWNAAATRMFGYAPEEAVGRSITILIPEDRLNEEAQTLAAIRRGEAIHHFRTVRLRKNRTPISISLTVSPIRNAAGEIIGASKIARDISLQVQAEEQRATLLAREQAARQEAESANRTKDEFLAMLGHELRNPLGAISNAVHVLERRGQPGDAAAAARAIIARQTAHLARLMDDLLDIGRVMSGKILLDRKPINLREVAERAVGTLREGDRLERHTVSIEGVPAWIDADATRIEQIVTNLLTNALKYTPPGGSIKLHVARKARTAVLRVEDNGLGIRTDLLPRIFDLFVQGNPRPDPIQGGLGIGLTLVKRIAELHGGSVEAHSDGPETGTAVTVRFPVIATPGRETEERDAPAEVPRRILIVEDNDDAREMLRTLLELRRHTVWEAVDGPSAIEAALQFQPDIALIDVGLPGLDGYEVARSLRASEGGKRMRLIALTGYGLPKDALRAREAGFDAHVVKPVHPDRLTQILAMEQPEPHA
jgi:two-component system, chemotaxis family, CheB/CheR fusion protein